MKSNKRNGHASIIGLILVSLLAIEIGPCPQPVDEYGDGYDHGDCEVLPAGLNYADGSELCVTANDPCTRSDSSAGTCRQTASGSYVGCNCTKN